MRFARVSPPTKVGVAGARSPAAPALQRSGAFRVRSRPTRYHFNTLGEHSGATLTIECEQCSLRREFQTNELLAFYGAEYRMVFLRYDLAACPAGKRHKDCGVRYSSI